MTLTPSQKRAYQAIHSGRSVCLTGAAGTGKSFLLQHLRDELGAEVTALTGTAACLVAGVTIHSWAGVGMVEEGNDPEYYADKINDFTRRRIANTEVLIIDEISMMSAHFCDVLDAVFREATNIDMPFGGIQMVMVGDMAQLPPVTKRGEPRYAFESRAWKELDPQVVILQECVRQTDQVFIDLLNAIRLGDDSVDFAPLLARRGAPPAGEVVPYITARNDDVDMRNGREVRKLPGEALNICSVDWGSEWQLKHSNLPTLLTLKPGARVMHLVNRNTLCNGSLGVIKSVRPAEIEGEWPHVEMLHEGDTHVIPVHSNEITNGLEDAPVRETALGWVDDKGFPVPAERVRQKGNAHYIRRPKVIAGRRQIPLRLAWSITAHKSQGSTLDAAHLDLARATQPGALYTMLSRVRSLDKLWIASLPTEINVCDKVRAFYRDHQNA